MNKHFYKVCFFPFGQKIKVLSGMSYDIRRTLDESVLSYSGLIRSSLDADAPEGYEFEYGKYSTENNLELLSARENSSKVISENIKSVSSDDSKTDSSLPVPPLDNSSSAS